MPIALIRRRSKIGRLEYFSLVAYILSSPIWILTWRPHAMFEPILSDLILSYLILSYLILSYLILSYLISSHLISSHLISSHLISSHLISSHLISFKHSTSGPPEPPPPRHSQPHHGGQLPLSHWVEQRWAATWTSRGLPPLSLLLASLALLCASWLSASLVLASNSQSEAHTLLLAEAQSWLPA